MLKKYSKILILGLVGAILLITALVFGTRGKKINSPNKNPSSHRMVVVTTLLPIYDFAKEIGGDQVDVTLILPPGAQSHGYEPRPSDIRLISEADILFYTSDTMEPWVQRIKKEVKTNASGSKEDETSKVKIISVDQGIAIMAEESHSDDEYEAEMTGEEEHHHDESGVDPHYWLDPSNAIIMADNILSNLSISDKKNTSFYANNAAKLRVKLEKLDTDFAKGLSSCGTKSVYHAGHFAFGYLAKRYGFEYHAIKGAIPESEVKASVIADFVNGIKLQNIKAIYLEDSIDPKLANIIAEQSGAKVFALHSAHNVSAQDIKSGENYISIMRSNLKNLVIGLDCQ